MKEIKQDIKKKVPHVHVLENHIVKISEQPKTNHRFNVMSIKIPMVLFMAVEKF